MHNNSLSVMLFDKKFVANTIRDFLKCPSCRSDFSANFYRERGTHIRSNRPVLLTCGHSMCENCIQQNYKNLACPACSRPLPVPQKCWANFEFRTLFELNFFLLGTMRHLSYYRSDDFGDSSILNSSEDDKRISKILKNRILFKCGECEEISAVGKCMQCNVNYCENCFEAVHMNSKVLKSHSLSSIEAQKFKIRFEKPQPKVCQEHHETCDRYCFKCCNTYCRNCIRYYHVNHSSGTLVERNKLYMDDILSVLEKVKQSREKVGRAQRVSTFHNYLLIPKTQIYQTITEHYISLWSSHLILLNFNHILCVY